MGSGWRLYIQLNYLGFQGEGGVHVSDRTVSRGFCHVLILILVVMSSEVGKGVAFIYPAEFNGFLMSVEFVYLTEQ